jgi:F420-non-reducing hydrogenase iron-sulfur subunit
VRIVKLACSGRVDALLLLRAFAAGADAVYVAGCALGDCHYLKGNLRAIEEVTYAKRLLAEIGIAPERLEFFHVPASAGPRFAECADEMTKRARDLGPIPLGRAAADPGRSLPLAPDAHPPLPEATPGRIVRHEERITPDPAGEGGATP